MRNLFIVTMILFSNMLMAQRSTTLNFPQTGPVDCPYGYTPTLHVVLQFINFHKPRTNCTSGFGLCFKHSAYVSCDPNWRKSSLSGTTVDAVGKINKEVIELHIPLALKYQKGFEKTDFSTFELEDKSFSIKTETGIIRYVKAGVYPVSVVDDEFVVNLPLN